MKIGILECGHTMPEVEAKHGTFPDMFAYEDHPFIPPLEAFIRDSYAAGVPMVGICFGHQIIAQALGGHVEKFKDGWALGLNEYDFDGLGKVKLNAWHQDQVLRLPEDAQVLASNDFCANAALVYDDRALTVQPHPEFAGPIIGDYVKLRRGTADYGEDVMDQAGARLAEQDNNAALAKQIATFFKQPREARHG